MKSRRTILSAVCTDPPIDRQCVRCINLSTWEWRRVIRGALDKIKRVARLCGVVSYYYSGDRGVCSNAPMRHRHRDAVFPPRNAKHLAALTPEHAVAAITPVHAASVSHSLRVHTWRDAMALHAQAVVVWYALVRANEFLRISIHFV